MSLVDAQIGEIKGYIGDRSTFRASKFANAVHRVMVIEGEQVLPTWSKGIGLGNELEGAAGIRCEDHGIFIG